MEKTKMRLSDLSVTGQRNIHDRQFRINVSD
jgi:hypothetical protein